MGGNGSFSHWIVVAGKLSRGHNLWCQDLFVLQCDASVRLRPRLFDKGQCNMYYNWFFSYWRKFCLNSTPPNKRGTKYLVFSTVSKCRVVVGAKWMVPARVWTLGTRWTTLTQNDWVLWFTWSICTRFKNTIC